jgi:hypothetical protein
MLHSLDRAAQIILGGRPVLVAGQEALLAALPRGNWIGGTIPYFMDRDGGVISEDQVFVTELPAELSLDSVRWYAAGELPAIVRDAPENGLTAIIIPSGSEAHTAYAQGAPGFDGLFMKPIVGWIAGTHLRDLGKARAKVFDGRTGERSTDRAIAMHLGLPLGKLAVVRTVNLFAPGRGETVSFERDGFVVTDCLVDGRRWNFAEYLVERRIDTRLPLVADYSGTKVNVSFQAIDKATRTVSLYAPVFAGVEYRIAAPVADYVRSFEAVMPRDGVAPAFACNCILNFLYSELEHKKTGTITGPVTFGEIAYQLLNQTLVYVTIEG